MVGSLQSLHGQESAKGKKFNDHHTSVWNTEYTWYILQHL